MINKIWNKDHKFYHPHCASPAAACYYCVKCGKIVCHFCGEEVVETKEAFCQECYDKYVPTVESYLKAKEQEEAIADHRREVTINLWKKESYRLKQRLAFLNNKVDKLIASYNETLQEMDEIAIKLGYKEVSK